MKFLHSGMQHRSPVAALTAALTALLVGCQLAAPVPESEPDPDTAHDGLENLHAFAPGVYSGSMPHGDAGFERLRQLGIQSIISVDGVPPDVERAQQRGMRTVHLPIGYDGIEADRRDALAHAFRVLPRPIYVHCHHGRHRGPAAAAYGLIAMGTINSAEGIERLELAGTSRSYSGLYEVIEVAHPRDPAELAAIDVDLPSKAMVSGFTEAMARLDRHWSHVKQLATNDWHPPMDHPDLVATAEAGLVHDLLRATETMPTQVADRAFADLLADAVDQARQLENALMRQAANDAHTAFKALEHSCIACHRRYRN